MQYETLEILQLCHLGICMFIIWIRTGLIKSPYTSHIEEVQTIYLKSGDSPIESIQISYKIQICEGDSLYFYRLGRAHFYRLGRANFYRLGRAFSLLQVSWPGLTSGGILAGQPSLLEFLAGHIFIFMHHSHHHLSRLPSAAHLVRHRIAP